MKLFLVEIIAKASARAISIEGMLKKNETKKLAKFGGAQGENKKVKGESSVKEKLICCNCE